MAYFKQTILSNIYLFRYSYINLELLFLNWLDKHHKKAKMEGNGEGEKDLNMF